MSTNSGVLDASSGGIRSNTTSSTAAGTGSAGGASAGGGVTAGGSGPATGGMYTGGFRTTGGLGAGGFAGQSSSVAAGGTHAAGGAAPTGGWVTTGGGQSLGGVSSSGGATHTGGQGTSVGANACGTFSGNPGGLPGQTDIINLMRRANSYFTTRWPDPTAAVVVNGKTHESHLWTRAVYFEGLMDLYQIEPVSAYASGYYNYAVQWSSSPLHPWQVYGGDDTTRNADYQCCGQTYIDLYGIDPQPVRISHIKPNIDSMLGAGSNADWTWIDAIQMAMPVFAKLGAKYANTNYFEKMHALYANTKTTQGLYNQSDHLWWRDATFKPPFTTRNGKQCYWSRGNGWVFAALARVLDSIPTTEAHRSEYVADFKAMATVLKVLQRVDGFWNVSLADPSDYGGPELSGTALFTYAMAWGMRSGILDATYSQTVTNAWCAIMSAVHTDGSLGYVQGTGSQPSDGQPVTFNSVPDYQDFGLGCFLLAGSEVFKLAPP